MFDDQLLIHFKEIENIVNKTSSFIEGNLICHTSTSNSTVDRNKNKILNVKTFVQNKKSICEIGFNAGHSLLIMLSMNPNAEYVLFDINMHNYTEPCLEYIKQQYSKTKITMIFGDSKETLPRYIKNNKDKTFDLIHVDGGHDSIIIDADFNNSLKMSNSETIIIFDDYNLKNIKKYINRKLKYREIIEVDEPNYKKNEYHIIYKNET